MRTCEVGDTSVTPGQMRQDTAPAIVRIQAIVVAHLEIDVGEDRQAYQEMKELSDQTYVPTFVAGDKVLANFDTDQLEEFLRAHEIHP